VVPSHLADSELFDFRNVSRSTEVGEGDIVFDAPELPVGAGSTDIPIGIWRS
jgi:tRNA 2-thiocytidine biosynthesis protein TtcA